MAMTAALAPTRARIATVAVLGALYLAQGVVAGFAGFVLIPRMAAAGVSVEAQAGLLAIAGLPWVLKVGWGPVLDRLGARRGRRPALVVSGAMLGVAVVLWWLGHAVGDGSAADVDVGRVQTLWLGLSVLLSLQDVATDALALDRVASADRGLANSVMLGSSHVGNEGVGGMALGAAVVASGLGSAFVGMALLFVVLAAAPMLLPEPDAASTDATARVPWRTAVRAMVATRSAVLAVFLAAVVMVGDVATSAVSGAFWVQRLGWSPQRVVDELPPLLLVASVVGYFVAAVVVDRLGALRATAAGAVALGLLWIGFGLAEGAWTSATFLRGFVLLQSLATAVMFVGVYAALMNATVPTLRATHFAVLMALLNLPRVVVPNAAAAVLGSIGFAGLFVACGVLQLGVGALARTMAAPR